MTLPNFLYIGAPRAGSTWIFEALRAHPQIFVPPAKYVKYFNDKEFHRGLSWYESFFDDANASHKAIGEFGTNYLYNESSLTRIREILPDTKILACLRNPIERDWSAYLRMKRNNEVSGSFREEMESLHGEPFIYDRGKYYNYIPKVYEIFPHDMVKVMLFDDLKENPAKFAAELYKFLDVDPFEFEYVDQQINAAQVARNKFVSGIARRAATTVRSFGLPNLVGRVKNLTFVQKALFTQAPKTDEFKLTAEDRAYLIDLHSKGINDLANTLNRDLSAWLR